ncbi:MAG: phosphoesterase PA-phosphatase-like protein, partial [bacterium]
KKLVAVFISIAILVAYSRVYVGVHYPFDVLGGAVIGVICAGIILIIERRICLLLSQP